MLLSGSLFSILICVFGFVVGGHTAEMINLLSVMQINRFAPRYYIAAATDNMSLQKARVFEETLDDKVHTKFDTIHDYCFLMHSSFAQDLNIFLDCLLYASAIYMFLPIIIAVT